jgi:hypothetical protein
MILDEREQSIEQAGKGRQSDFLTIILFTISVLLLIFRWHDPVAAALSLGISVVALASWTWHMLQLQKNIDVETQKKDLVNFPHFIPAVTYVIVALAAYFFSIWIAVMLPFLIIGWFLAWQVWKKPGMSLTVKLCLTLSLLLFSPVGLIWFIAFLLKSQPKVSVRQAAKNIIISITIFLMAAILNVVLLRIFIYEPTWITSNVLAPEFPQGSLIIFDKTLAARRSVESTSFVLVNQANELRVFPSRDVQPQEVIGVLQPKLSTIVNRAELKAAAKAFPSPY